MTHVYVAVCMNADGFLVVGVERTKEAALGMFTRTFIDAQARSGEPDELQHQCYKSAHDVVSLTVGERGQGFSYTGHRADDA